LGLNEQTYEKTKGKEMNKQVNYSEVPVGQKFEYKGKIYTRSTHCRGKQVVEGTQSFTLFKKCVYLKDFSPLLKKFPPMQ